MSVLCSFFLIMLLSRGNSFATTTSVLRHTYRRVPATDACVGNLNSLDASTAGKKVTPIFLSTRQGFKSGMITATKKALQEPELCYGVGLKSLLRTSYWISRLGHREPSDDIEVSDIYKKLASDIDTLAALFLFNGILRSMGNVLYSKSVSNLIPLTAKMSYGLYTVAKAGQLHNYTMQRGSYKVRKLISLLVVCATAITMTDSVSSSPKTSIISKLLSVGGLNGILLNLFTKDAANNMFAGTVVQLNQRLRPGDIVSFKVGGTEYRGEVRGVGLMQTILISSKDNQSMIYIPNSLLAHVPITQHIAPNRIKEGRLTDE